MLHDAAVHIIRRMGNHIESNIQPLAIENFLELLRQLYSFEGVNLWWKSSGSKSRLIAVGLQIIQVHIHRIVRITQLDGWRITLDLKGLSLTGNQKGQSEKKNAVQYSSTHRGLDFIQ